MLTVPKLNRWAIFRDVLVGEAIDHPKFENRQRVATNKIINVDEKNRLAICVADEIWQLGEPGNLGMYVDPVSRRFF